MLKFYDFFAGAGLATLALRHAWECIWANDNDEKKARVYLANFPGHNFVCKDIAHVSSEELPAGAHMAWASFPCQDLSLAGWRKGLSAERSGTFWAFWRLMHQQFKEGKRPPLIVIENVLGLLYGDNFRGLCEALAALGAQFGALVIDAKHFLPQSRPRVFVVVVDAALRVDDLCGQLPNPVWTPASLRRATFNLPESLHNLWRWWQLPLVKKGRPPLPSIVEEEPTMVEWHAPEETEYVLSLMDDTNLAKVQAARRLHGKHIGFLYKRIRNGVQRAEVRFDGLAGCLRTPQGGSSRQTVLVVENSVVRSRLLSPREAARLMGVPETFKLPGKYNDAYRAMGDGVAVPAVRWLSEHLLEPLTNLVGREMNHAPANPTVTESLKNSEERAVKWGVGTNGRAEHRRDRA